MAENEPREKALPETGAAALPLLASSPHIVSPVHTRRIMLHVLLALTPVSVFGVVLFGLHALLTILVCVASAVAAENLFRYAVKRDIRIHDLSAVVTGLLLALIVPPSTPLWMSALGALFAILAAKEFFGGLGANVFNPALSGRAFLLMSFPAALTTWHHPVGFSEPLTDAVSGPTPLGGILTASGMADADFRHTAWTLFIGNHGGCIGETSILLILAGACYLLITKVIDWRAPAAMTAAVIAASLALGLNPALSILSGGALFGAVFMATDYVSTPVTGKGRLLFGFGAGVITVLIRKWGDFPEGVTYGILIMNAVTPFLNRLLNR